MKYYLATNSTNVNEIGIYPHGHCIDKENNIVELENLARLTDLIAITNYHINYQMALSEKAVSLLNPFWNETKICRKSIQFLNRQVRAHYSLIEFNEGIETIIDFRASQFGVEKADTILALIENIDSYEKYKSKHKAVFLGETTFPKWSHLKCTKLVLKSKPIALMTAILSGSYFFRLPGVLMSQEIYDCIKTNNLTGFAFNEIDIDIE